MKIKYKFNLIMILVGVIFIIVQYLFIPIELVLKIRENAGPFGTIVLSPLIIGISLIIFSKPNYPKE